MNDLPFLTRRLCERTLDAYCERICPPSVRNAVNIGYRIERAHITLFEWRPICGVPGTRRDVPVAQMRWSARDNLWRLYHTEERSTLDERQAWRRADAASPRRSFIEMLRDIDADPQGLFWGQVDGKSLRWCSSRGRCAQCDEKYCRALGLEAQSNHA